MILFVRLRGEDSLICKMDMSCRFYPFDTRNPFIIEVKSHEDNTLVFDGYFYVDQKDLPVQRIMATFGEPYVDEDGTSCRSMVSSSHIEIYEKISGEDTSYYGDESPVADLSGNTTDLSGNEEDDWNICFFPTEITTLKYRVMKSDLTKLEFDSVSSAIKEAEKERENKRLTSLMSAIDDEEEGEE